MWCVLLEVTHYCTPNVNGNNGTNDTNGTNGTNDLDPPPTKISVPELSMGSGHYLEKGVHLQTVQVYG